MCVLELVCRVRNNMWQVDTYSLKQCIHLSAVIYISTSQAEMVGQQQCLYFIQDKQCEEFSLEIKTCDIFVDYPFPFK